MTYILCLLNYEKYDPSYNPGTWEFVFRVNILIVDDSEIDKFIKAIEGDKIYSCELTKEDIEHIVFYIDFDTKLFVSCFNEVEVEEYLAHDGWQGKYDDPVKYLSAKCKIKELICR